jgi:hypothetical protein
VHCGSWRCIDGSPDPEDQSSKGDVMTSHQRRGSSTVVAVALAACWLALGGCGDRSLGVPRADGGAAGQTPPSGAGGQASGGSQGQAGAVGGSAGTFGGTAGTFGGTAGTFGGAAGASGGTAGASGGSAGFSGGSAGISGGTAGAAGGSPCPCPAIACAIGFALTPDPASCCPVCKPIVCNGACVVPTCGPDSHVEKAPGQCCPTCMPGMNDSACTAGRQTYAADRAATVEKYTEGGCMSDDDCALFYENNQCAWTCGTAINADLVMDATSNLDSAATIDCGTCPPNAVAPPCALQVALCSNGKCVAGIPPAR